MSWNIRKSSKTIASPNKTPMQGTDSKLFKTKLQLKVCRLRLRWKNLCRQLGRRKRLNLMMSHNYYPSLESSDYQNFDSRNTKNDFSIELSSTSTSCWIEILMEETTPLFTEKYNFESRDKSILTAPPNFWYHMEFDAKNSQWLIKLNLLF